MDIPTQRSVCKGADMCKHRRPTSVASLPSYEHEQLQLVLPSLMSSYAAITNGLSHMRSLSSNKSMSGNGLSVSGHNQN